MFKVNSRKAIGGRLVKTNHKRLFQIPDEIQLDPSIDNTSGGIKALLSKGV